MFYYERNKNKILSVFLVTSHAPDYRESFFRELSKHVDLTVLAQPCEPDKLLPPKTRCGYKYIELKSIRFFGLRWQTGMIKYIKRAKYDIFCIGLCPRIISTILPFFIYPELRTKWIWRGQIFGRNKSLILSFIRKFLLNNCAGCLVYSELIADKLQLDFKINSVSFNNTEISIKDFKTPCFYNSGKFNKLNIIFVGRYQKRKKLSRLIEIAKRRDDVVIKLIGPNMSKLKVPKHLINNNNVILFDKITGDKLVPHFNWSHVVFNPGHAGLLVMNAAKHGRSIVIDSKSSHAPEYYMAKCSGQFFIDFSDKYEVDSLINYFLSNQNILIELAIKHQNIAKEKYTIENMAFAHYKLFNKIANKF